MANYWCFQTSTNKWEQNFSSYISYSCNDWWICYFWFYTGVPWTNALQWFFDLDSQWTRTGRPITRTAQNSSLKHWEGTKLEKATLHHLSVVQLLWPSYWIYILALLSPWDMYRVFCFILKKIPISLSTFSCLCISYGYLYVIFLF